MEELLKKTIEKINKDYEEYHATGEVIYIGKLLESQNRLLAVISAGIVCPVVNTGVFLIGCRIFFLKQIQAWGFSSIWNYMVLGIGLNFVVELLINLVLSSVIVRLIDIKLQKKY